jgi:hypothetical protein
VSRGVFVNPVIFTEGTANIRALLLGEITLKDRLTPGILGLEWETSTCLLDLLHLWQTPFRLARAVSCRFFSVKTALVLDRFPNVIMIALTSPRSLRTGTSRRVWEAIPWGAISSGAGRFLDDFASVPVGGSYWTIAKGVGGVFARRAGRRFPGGEETGAVKLGAAESVEIVELGRP